MKTTTVRGVEVCDHGINVKFCGKCKAIAESKAPLQSKIAKVMEDHLWHSLMSIAHSIGVMTPDNACYNDIGRGLRLLRSEQNGAWHVAKRYVGGLYEYRMLTREEQAQLPKQAPVPADPKDEEIAFLKEYIAELELRLAGVPVQSAPEAAKTAAA